MREDNRHRPVDLDIAALLELLDGVWAMEWASQVPVIVEKNVI
jgi:hypothetical protein